MKYNDLICNLLYADRCVVTKTGVAWGVGNKIVAFIKHNSKTKKWLIWIDGIISDSFETRSLAEEGLMTHLMKVATESRWHCFQTSRIDFKGTICTLSSWLLLESSFLDSHSGILLKFLLVWHGYRFWKLEVLISQHLIALVWSSCTLLRMGQLLALLWSS